VFLGIGKAEIGEDIATPPLRIRSSFSSWFVHLFCNAHRFAMRSASRNHRPRRNPSPPDEPSAMHRCRAALILFARASVATPLQSCNPPQSTKKPDSCGSTLSLLIRRENGCRRNGRYASPQRMGAALTYARRAQRFRQWDDRKSEAIHFTPRREALAWPPLEKIHYFGFVLPSLQLIDCIK